LSVGVVPPAQPKEDDIMSSNKSLTAIQEALSSTYFDVCEERLFTANGQQVPGKKVICAKDSGQPLAVVGDKYKTVTNEEVFSSFVNILGNSALDLSGAEVETEFSHDGARTFAQIILPAHQFQVGEKDPTALRIIAKNSYDGSTAFTVQAGGYRFVCSNGQVMGTDISYFKSKHVPSLDVKTAASHISGVLESFENSRDWFDELRGRKVTDSQAYAVLAYASRNSEALRKGLPESKDDMPRTMKALYETWVMHEKSMGRTAWALYNTLTYFSTHWDRDREAKHENAAASKFRREERVRETLQSRVWNEQIAA
jgi:hypothetical protein